MGLLDYKAVKFVCDEQFREILIAELGEMDFETMMETSDGLEAYVQADCLNEQQIVELIQRYEAVTTITHTVSHVVSRNWNEEWEKNYDPVEVDDQILVRASFHESKAFPYEIVINPRMSFGTAHHSTTYLMLKNQLSIDHKGKRVLDAGCGTAILAVLAEKLGASEVVAYDNNSWSTENAPENVQLNNCSRVTILEGTIDTLNFNTNFDIILANINKNVLLAEMPQYAAILQPGGIICFSGFYREDDDDMTRAAESHRLRLIRSDHKNDWSTLIFNKEL